MSALLDLRMPGVYTLEVPTLQPTTAVVQSAVPVFIGYTEKASRKGKSLSNQAIRIKSMRDYDDWFGGAKKVAMKVSVDESTAGQPPVVSIDEVPDLKHRMHYALRLYYANGGGPCFIYSVGTYEDNGGTPDPNQFDINQNDELKKQLQLAKDVTILVFPDAIGLSNYKTVITSAIGHCKKMKNRVTVIDMENGDEIQDSVAEDAEAFQGKMPITVDDKKYGMAYYPFLNTGISFAYDKEGITLENHTKPDGEASAEQAKIDAAIAAKTAYDTAAGDAASKQQVAKSKQDTADQKAEDAVAAQEAAAAAPGDQGLQDAAAAADTAATDAQQEADNAQQEATAAATTAAENRKAWSTAAAKAKLYEGLNLQELEVPKNNLYGAIADELRRYPVTLPPSSAIAGVYVRTDATQGPWKAPANTSVYGVVSPAIELDDDDHATLNAPDNGKAINAIRAYPGRGILVYGARTLAGSDLEWRYVNVRRTFCFIEDTIARSMQDFVFAPNTQETWIKVRSMINAFLNRIWKAGGLYGATPEDAYEVLVGEPDTMSVEDVLTGIMRVVIKVAVARPAEFIVLQYEHKFELADG